MNPFFNMNRDVYAPASPFFNMNPYQSDDPGLSLDPNFTTVMLRNIPNKYTAKMLLDVLDKRFAKQYDYVYLPVDFVNHCNVGYAFINLRGYETRIKFYKHFHNQKVKDVLPGFNSKKVLKQVCEVNKAKVQGAKENIRRIRQMNMLMQRLKEHPEWVPLIFDSDGKAIPLDLDGVTEAEERILEKPQQFRDQAGAPGASNMPRDDYAPSSYGMYNQSPYSSAWEQHAAQQQHAAHAAQAAQTYHAAANQHYSPYHHAAAAYQHPAASGTTSAAGSFALHQQHVFDQIMAYSQAHAAYQSALQSAASYANNAGAAAAAAGAAGAAATTGAATTAAQSPGESNYYGEKPNESNYYSQAKFADAKRVSNSTAAKSPYTSSTTAGSPLETSYYKQEMMGEWYPGEMASYQ